MKRFAVTSAAERLRAATAAVAERDRLVRMKSQLASDLAGAEQRVVQLEQQLGREQMDVDRLSSAAHRFLNDLLGNTQLSREHREVAEAAAQLREATRARDTLRAHARNLEARLAVLTPDAIADELRAARAAKEAEVVEAGGPPAASLQELDVRLESIDIELVPLQDALASGHLALAKLAEIITVLDAGDDVRESRKQASATRALAGEAQARMIGFGRALDELATSGAERVNEEPPDATFADGWIGALLGSGDRGARIAAARASIGQRIEYVRAKLTVVRTRHDELAVRRTALVGERDELLAR